MSHISESEISSLGVYSLSFKTASCIFFCVRIFFFSLLASTGSPAVILTWSDMIYDMVRDDTFCFYFDFGPFLFSFPFFFSLCFSLFSFHLRRFFFSEKERDILVHIIGQGKKSCLLFLGTSNGSLGNKYDWLSPVCYIRLLTVCPLRDYVHRFAVA